MRVWREGDRIRDASGRGYGDRVTDSAIETHVARATADERRLSEELEAARRSIDFATSVLSYRAAERATAASPERTGTA